MGIRKTFILFIIFSMLLNNLTYLAVFADEKTEVDAQIDTQSSSVEEASEENDEELHPDIRDQDKTADEEEPNENLQNLSEEIVFKLQQDLEKLGFMIGISYEGIFDDDTRQEIEEFQEYFNLEVTGEADEETLLKIEEIMTSDFSEGQKNEDIIELKENLNELGFTVPTNSPDSYGPATVEAVKHLQEDNELRVSGIADEVTLDAIEELLNDQAETKQEAIEEKIEEAVGIKEDDESEVESGEKDSHAVIINSFTMEQTEVAVETGSLPYKRGDNHEGVTELKENLNKLGFTVSMNAPSNFGPATERTVREFQEYYGLSVTGQAGQETLGKIEEILSSPFRRGQSHDEVITLKNNLNELGFSVTMNSPPSYGPATEQAVRDFQQHYGLRVNGIADEVTLVKIEELLDKANVEETYNLPYKRGDNHEGVTELKENLNKLGFTVSMNAPSNFGPATERTVREFQEYYGISVTGEAGGETLGKIEEILSSPFRRGQSHDDVVTLKNNLNELGFSVTMNSPPSYGPATEQAVRDFQQHYGLRVNGIADEVTLVKIEELLEKANVEETYNLPYKRGDNHEGVTELKENLNKLGFTVSMNAPSNFGPATERTVREFQEYYGLSVTGQAGQESLGKIEEILSSPFRRGQSHDEVITLKNNLNELGFSVTMNSPPSYGPSTEQAVRDFQQYYGLRVNGIADEVTLAKIDNLIQEPTVFKRGDNHPKVEELKTHLNELGFTVSMNAPNNFGPATERTVREFQEYYGLSVTGEAGEETFSKIEEILSSPYRRGESSSLVAEFKNNLNIIGNTVTMNSPESYGPSTERAVREFQQYFGLRVNGIGDTVTLAKIEELLSSALRRGQRNEETAILKNNLNSLGFEVSMSSPQSYGPETERAVRDFQQYYGLVVNGIGDTITLAKINEILTSPLRRGEVNEGVEELKNKLNILGFNIPMNSPQSYGPSTEGAVREFQEYYGLRVNGIADENTVRKVEEILNSPLRRGQVHKDVAELKTNLNKLGFPVSMNSPESYGPATEQAVRDFQSYYGLKVSGIADYVTLNLLVNVLDGKPVISYTNYDYSISHMLNIQSNRGPRTDTYTQRIAYVSSEYINRNGSTGTVTASTLNVRFEPNTRISAVGTLRNGDQVTIIGTEPDTNTNTNRTWYAIEFNHGEHWQFARPADILNSIDPSRFSTNITERDIYQFLLLSETSGVSADYLNQELSGRGILSGRGNAFREAANTYSVNEFYLLSHSILETGHGTSPLSNGSIRVGRLGTNKWVSIQPDGTFIAERNGNTWSSTWTIERVNNFDESQAQNIKQTYNMFGIGAIDSCPYVCGSIRAYEEGWDTANKAIVGGTRFIAQDYVHHPVYQQDTLYKMRWNPGQPGTHQYATDIGWAYKQTSMLYRHYQNLPHLRKTFDIPNYR